MTYLTPTAALPAHVLARNDVRRALKDHDFGRLFFLARKWGGISYSKIAESTDIKPQRVGTLARGEGAITTYAKVCEIADGLRIPGRMLGLADRPWEDRERHSGGNGSGHDLVDPVNRRHLMQAAAGAAGFVLTPLDERLIHKPDDATAEHLASLVHDLRRADDTAPTGSLLPAAAKLVELAERLTDATPPGRRQSVGRAAAEAATLHWWLTVDSGRNAQRSHDRALSMAIEWGYAPLVGHLFGWRAGLALGKGELLSAVRLARKAREPQWAVSQGGIAWATAYEARAHLLAGNHDDAQRAFEIARSAYAGVDPAEEPPWLYWLSGVILELETLDMALLQEGPGAASHRLDAALSRLPQERARDAAWYRAHIAAARVRAGDCEGAVQDALEAARLSTSTGTTWTLTELRQLAAGRGQDRLRQALEDTTW